MNKDISDDEDPDMLGVPAALARASKRARKLAEQTGTEFVVMRDGKLVREIPTSSDTVKAQDLPPEAQ